MGDVVIGVVLERQAEHYVVDIMASNTALLPMMAFEGASKRNRPNLRTGCLVYARVALADQDMMPKLSCIVSQGEKKVRISPPRAASCSCQIFADISVQRA